MIVLGVTGPSGAGKGEFCSIMQSLGAKSLDTDLVAREVVKPGSKCLYEIGKHFGPEIILANGEMDRKRVAQIVFSDKEKLEFLNKTTHKYIVDKIKEWLFECEISGEKLLIIDAPQLFEAGADEFCNFTLCVLADSDTRLSRIISRDKISQQAATLRQNNQKDDSFFTDKCDYVVYNDGNLKTLKKKAEQIFNDLMSHEEYFN